MHTSRLVSVLVGLAVVVAVMTLPVVAAPQKQGGNLLQDPGFDLVAQSAWKWKPWAYTVEIMKPDSKKDPDLTQSFYAPSVLPSDPKWDHGSGGQSGAAAAVSGQTFTKFRGGLYQTVDVGKGARVRFSIWTNEFCEGGCTVLLKAGIDPTGGTDWNSGNIKWAAAEVSNNRYVQLVTEDVTAGDSGQVTVFTWGEPEAPAAHTAAYFDDAALTTTAASAAPITQATSAATSQPGQPNATAQPGACAQLRWVSDVTIPDDSAVAPGSQFVKTWRVKNNGTCAFEGTLNFIGAGNQMGGSSPAKLPKIEAGQQADVSVNLTAPTQAGSYQGTWQPRAADGTAMENLVVRIKVSAAAPTAVAGVTATPQSQPSPTPTTTPTPVPSQICVQAFDDVNGDGQHGGDETLLAGVVFVLSDANGPKDSYTTDGVSEPHCFADLALGDYKLTARPPANYASTTFDTVSVSLTAGIQPSVAYGAKRSGLAPAPTRADSVSTGGATSGGLLGTAGRTILIVIGVLILVGLAGVGGFLLLGRRTHL